MELKRIKALLEKYYKGETSKEEEKILQKYFSEKDVADELEADKDIFLYQLHDQNVSEEIPDISDEIWESIHSQEDYKSKKNNKLIYISLRIAAGIAILVASYFLVNNQAFRSNGTMMVDTYEDPELAYEQAKETLLYVSTMLNNGANHLEPMQNLNKGTQKLNTISTFNKGLEELNPIKKYNKADKYFKQ